MKDNILLKKHYLIEGKDTSNKYEYFAAKLFNTFAITVDKPSKLTADHVRLISEFYEEIIPASFYNNPQDLKYFTTDELLLEQLVSYFKIEFFTGIDSTNKEDFERIEIFKKALPKYEEGDEIVTRNYEIITKEEADIILKDYCKSLCEYSRRWSLTERAEFSWLYRNNYHESNFKLVSKDNALDMFLEIKEEYFTKSLDQKDVVKLSIILLGEYKKLRINEDNAKLLTLAAKNCKKTKLTKKQSKYFNTLINRLDLKLNKVSNEDSVYKEVIKLLQKDKPVDAAKVLSENGSMLERNLIWMLSRADEKDYELILDLLEINNPIVSFQLIIKLLKKEDKRTFSFVRNRKVKSHEETEYEAKYRKTRLSDRQKERIKDIMLSKIKKHYKNKATGKKAFIDPDFYNVAIPMNTSTAGSGLDVLPTGSRLPINGDYIRAFTYWDGPTDVDTSVNFIKKGVVVDTLYWGSYAAKVQESLGHSVLYSGDDRSSNGSEFCDFRISELQEKGYEYCIYIINGYGSSLNIGKTYSGYQNKDNLDTIAWSSKNIEMKIQIFGDSRSFFAFAIDLKTKEIIVLNQMQDNMSRVVMANDFKTIEHFLDKDIIKNINVGKIIEWSYDLVENIEDAEIVFSNNADINEDQQRIRTNDIAKFIEMI